MISLLDMLKAFKSPLFFFSVVFIFLSFFQAPIDSDLGWHLRYGEYFFKTGSFLKTNILTYYLPNYFWQNSYTLYQVLIFLIYKYLNFFGLSLANALLLAFAYLIFRQINPQFPKLNFIFFVLISLFAWNIFYLGFRSQEFTFFFLLIVFYYLNKINFLLTFKKNIRLIFTFFLIFLLWVNLHGAFILGIAFIGLSLFNSLVNKEWKKAKLLSLLIIAAIFGTLINPYFLGIYKETFKHLVYPLPSLIAEWTPPVSWQQIVIVTTAFVLIFSFASSKNKRRIFWILALFSISYLSIKSRRNLPIFGLVAGLSVLDILSPFFLKLEKLKVISQLVTLILFIGIPLVIFTNIGKSFTINFNLNNYCDKGLLPYPCKAINFIRLNKIPGQNVFSSYEWGGFLEWQLPNYKFFVDGRTPAWITPEGKSPYTIYLEIIQAQPGYQQNLEKYKTDWLLIGAGTFLDIELNHNKNTPWKEIYRDNISVIYFPKN